MTVYRNIYTYKYNTKKIMDKCADYKQHNLFIFFINNSYRIFSNCIRFIHIFFFIPSLFFKHSVKKELIKRYFGKV